MTGKIIHIDQRVAALVLHPDGRYAASCHAPMTRAEALAHWGGADLHGVMLSAAHAVS